jgi:hypothetical protein
VRDRDGEARESVSESSENGARVTTPRYWLHHHHAKFGVRYALNAAVCAVANLVCVCDKENKAGKADRPGGLARGDTGERRLSFLVGKIFHGFFDT